MILPQGPHPGYPTGTVAFLFTDVEGSTRLWQQYRGGMRGALERHDTLVAEKVAHYGGVLVRPRGEGDSQFAVFMQASQAVAAACAFQLAMHHEPRQLPEPLRVRVALHTGEAEVREGDYYGIDVNRCARLRAIAHGGQVLLSGVTAALVREYVSANVRLVSLGLHQLKDVPEPEHVFQLVHPDLPSTFPPLEGVIAIEDTAARSKLELDWRNGLDGLTVDRRHNPPAPVNPLIGRQNERADVIRRLRESRLVTLTGSGGVGKTRVALEIARALVAEFDDGVWLAELPRFATRPCCHTQSARHFGSASARGSDWTRPWWTPSTIASGARQLRAPGPGLR